MAFPTTPDVAPLFGRNLSLDRGAFRIQDLDVALPTGQVTAILGPNGSGKSTLLRMLGRLLRPDAGQVVLDGRAITERSTRDVARRLAILPQGVACPDGVTVSELTAFGRHPHRGLLQSMRAEDRDAVEWALDVTALQRFRDRPVSALSGGERQRAWIAMALAQQTQVLLLDEPTTFLDIRYQLDVLELVRSLNEREGITVGWVLHDLNQAACYSDHMALLHDGRIAAQGSPDTVLREEILEAVFGISVQIDRHPTHGTPLVIPLSVRAPAPTPAAPVADPVPLPSAQRATVAPPIQTP